jgi:hypothetical protein
MKPLIYVDSSAIGGCLDTEFSRASNALLEHFMNGSYVMVLSVHTLRELEKAPQAVRDLLDKVPVENQILLADSQEALDLANEYIRWGIVGQGSHADALHVATATIGRVDVIVSWNFKHMVNVSRIRRFNGVNLANGYGPIDIRTPMEVLENE